MRTTSHLATSLSICLVGGLPASAQTTQTGAMMGVVKDGDGKPLAEVTLRAVSGQITRTTRTNARGEYRMPLMNLGAWTVSASRPGYITGTSQISVVMNETQTVNFRLALEANATVVVAVELGKVDLTATQASSNLSTEAIMALPVNQSAPNGLNEIVAATPGVEVYAPGATSGNYFYIRGAGDSENLFTVDGNATNSTASRGAQYYAGQNVQPPSEFMEGVEVVRGGFGAEYGVLGGVVNVSTKSGSNTWQAETYWHTNFRNASAVAKSNPRLGGTPSPGDSYQRYGVTLSGPIVKDHLFFFLGYQGFRQTTEAFGSVGKGGLNWNGLNSSPVSTKGPEITTLKLNWFLQLDHQLVLTATQKKATTDTGHQYPRPDPNRGLWQAGTADSGSQTTDKAENLNLTWNWTPSSNMVLVTSLGSYKNPHDVKSATGLSDATYWQDSRYFHDGPGRNSPDPTGGGPYAYVTGPNMQWGSYSKNPNTQFRTDFFWTLGHHQLRLGYLRQDTSLTTYEGTVTQFDISDPLGYAGESVTRISSGRGYRKVTGLYEAYYLKDQWEVAPGVRIDTGLRFEPFVIKGAFGPYDGRTLSSYRSFKDQVQPRLGATWDMNQDGRTKLYAYWGRTFLTQGLNSVDWATVTGLTYDVWYSGFTYNPDYSGTTPPVTFQTAPTFGMDLSAAGKPTAQATDLKLTHKDTLIFGADKVLSNGWKVGAVWTYWTLKDIQTSSYFTNADGTAAIQGLKTPVLWNPHSGPVTITDPDGKRHSWNSTFPDPKSRYISLDLNATYQGQNLFLAVDYAWQHQYGNFRGLGSNYIALGAGVGTSDSNWHYYRSISEGNVEAARVHALKLRGFYGLKIGGQAIRLGSVCTWHSGIGLAKTDLVSKVPGYNTANGAAIVPYYTTVQLDNRMSNMGYTPTTLNLDLSASMDIRVSKVVIQPSLSMTNVFNTRRATGYLTNNYNYISPNPGPNPYFGEENNWQLGRAVTAGVSVKF